jgi:predicted membrane protein
VILILLGFLFLMDTLDIMNFGRVFTNWWPVILIVVGFMKLRGEDKTKGAVLFIVGIVFLSATLDIINWGSVFRFWPLILIAVGLSIILKARGRSLWGGVASGEISEDFIKASAIFGGADRTVTSTGFKGGDIIALFGGVDLDLTRAVPSSEGCNLTLTAIFGGIEVKVPKDWQVSVSGTPIFGGIENKTTAGVEKAVGKIHCSCTVAFGGVEIKN